MNQLMNVPMNFTHRNGERTSSLPNFLGFTARPMAKWRTVWHNATSALVCPDCGKPRRATNFCRNLECKVSMRGIIDRLAGLRYHDLRHSAATKMLENGIPIATVAQVLGWSASTAIRMTFAIW